MPTKKSWLTSIEWAFPVRGRWLRYLTTALALLGLVATLALASLSHHRERPDVLEFELVQQVKSPDGIYKAAVFDGDNSARPGEYVFVHLNYSILWFDSSYSGHIPPGCIATAPSEVSVYWAGPRHLVVQGHPGPKSVYQADDQWGGVRITYR